MVCEVSWNPARTSICGILCEEVGSRPIFSVHRVATATATAEAEALRVCEVAESLVLHGGQSAWSMARRS